MKTALTRERIFALKGWTIKSENGKFYAAPTLNQTKWMGPYRSLQSATTAIARKLQAEYTERNAKLDAFHAPVDKRKKVPA